MLSENISQEMRKFKGFVYATFSTRNGFSMRFDALARRTDGGREACDEPRLDSITQPSSSLQQQGCDRSSAAYSTDLCVYVYYYIDIPPHFAAPLAEHSNAVCNVCFSQNLLVSVVPYTLKGGSVCYHCPFFSVKSKVTYMIS